MIKAITLSPFSRGIGIMSRRPGPGLNSPRGDVAQTPALIGAEPLIYKVRKRSEKII